MFNEDGVPGTGSMQLWTNGVLVGEIHNTDLPFTGFIGGQAANVHGGGIGASQQDKYLWIDHVYISIAPTEQELTVEPHQDIRFDGLQSTQELLTNSLGLGLWRNQQDIALDTVHPPGGPANSMRYRYPDLTDEPTRCDDRYITSGTMLPEDVTEVWVEVVVRFMEGFTTRSPASWNCPGANDLKFVYINFGESGTGGMPFGAYSSTVGLNTNSIRLRTPSDVSEIVFSERAQEELFSGEWITLRYHARLPTILDTVGSPGSGSGDGLYRLWWNDDLEIQIDDMSTAAYRFSHLLFGQNMNQGQDTPQDMWWNRIRVWTEDPGW